MDAPYGNKVKQSDNHHAVILTRKRTEFLYTNKDLDSKTVLTGRERRKSFDSESIAMLTKLYYICSLFSAGLRGS